MRCFYEKKYFEGILEYIVIFFGSFIYIWIAQYISLRIKLKAKNANINSNV